MSMHFLEYRRDININIYQYQIVFDYEEHYTHIDTNAGIAVFVGESSHESMGESTNMKEQPTEGDGRFGHYKSHHT